MFVTGSDSHFELLLSPVIVHHHLFLLLLADQRFTCRSSLTSL